MLDAGCWVLDTRCWVLDTSYWMLDAGCFRLKGVAVHKFAAVSGYGVTRDTGCWMLDRNQNSGRSTRIDFEHTHDVSHV